MPGVKQNIIKKALFFYFSPFILHIYNWYKVIFIFFNKS